MSNKNIFPVLLAVFSAVISFIAVVAISLKTFNFNLKMAILTGILFGCLFYILSYFRIKASFEIKRITRELNLTSQDLAKITGLRESDFPIYNGRLNLIIPKRHWPLVLERLREFEQSQEKNK